MSRFENHAIERFRTRPRDADAPEAALARAALLPQNDRILVELALRGRCTRRQIGEMLNLPPGTVTRRLQRLSSRLYDPLVIALLDRHCLLDPNHRQIGVEHFLLGLRVTQLSRQHAMPAGEVRSIITYLRGWHRGLAAGQLRTQRNERSDPAWSQR